MKRSAPIDPYDLYIVERRLSATPAVVIDGETTGLDWRRDKTIGYVLAFGPKPDDSYYLPFRHTGGANLEPRAVIEAMKSGIKANKTKGGLRLVNHNLAFDLKFMASDGIDHGLFGPLECTMVNAALIDERQRFSLAACCQFMGVQNKKDDELYAHLAAKFGGAANRDQMANYHKLAGDDPVGLAYARGDGTSTWQLWEAQQKELDDQGLRPIWDIESRLIRVLHRMTWRGIRVDEERLQQVITIVHRLQREAEKKLPKGFNVKAPTQLIKLFTDAGITNWPKTEKGNPSFDEEWLKTTPLGNAIIQVRKLRHLDNSFLTPMVERHLWKGRVHTTFNQTRGEQFGTITYRLSSNDPNMQQVHKRDDRIGSLFRSIFIPDNGMLMGTADYAQIEPCLLAGYGKVRVLLNGYRATPPIDAHSAVAKEIFGPQFTKPQRESAKRINQALLTGAGRAKIVLMLGGDVKEANRLVDTYFRLMPEIKGDPALPGDTGIQQYAASVLATRGYVRSLLGHRSRLADPSKTYVALNRLLQVGNADIIKKAMVDIDEYYVSQGDRVQMLLNIHDDIVTQWRPEDRPVYDRGLELMQDFGPGKAVEWDVPIRVDAHEGKNWAEATYTVDKVRENWAAMGARY